MLETASVSTPIRKADAEIRSLTIDSRKAESGSLFVCMPHMSTDSQQFIPDAAARGAVAALVYSNEGVELSEASGLGCALLEPEAFNEAIWRVCRTFFDSPTRDMRVVGVTGTNGKTTTAWLLRDMLRASGLSAAYLGTLGFQLPGEDRELQNTTPFAVDLFNMLAEAREKGVRALATEVSSHALEERRADGIEFDAGIFTNLTQDHLDYHGSMERYADAKKRLFRDLPRQTGKQFTPAFNVDDPVGRRWAVEFQPSISFGESDGDLRGEAIRVGVESIDMSLSYRGADRRVTVPLGGRFNFSNALAAAAGMLALGFEFGQVAELLPEVHPVPGRFEAVRNDRGIGVIVDYAHTPDALEKLLDSVRALGAKQVITVFGCGGDRDRTKRPKMARAASERSDVTVVTSDNPRTEDPEAILSEVSAGIVAGSRSEEIVDRREAIARAVSLASPGAVVVIAGKGHENYQIIGRTKVHMDDRELAREAIEALN